MNQPVLSRKHHLWEPFFISMLDVCAFEMLVENPDDGLRDRVQCKECVVPFVSEVAIDTFEAIGASWNCDGTLRQTRQVLEALNQGLSPREQFDVSRTLERILRSGRTCDCEVLVNTCIKTTDPEMFAALVGDRRCTCGAVGCTGVAEVIRHVKKPYVNTSAKAA